VFFLVQRIQQRLNLTRLDFAHDYGADVRRDVIAADAAIPVECNVRDGGLFECPQVFFETRGGNSTLFLDLFIFVLG
jgi:hypothetical protein